MRPAQDEKVAVKKYTCLKCGQHKKGDSSEESNMSEMRPAQEGKTKESQLAEMRPAQRGCGVG